MANIRSSSRTVFVFLLLFSSINMKWTNKYVWVENPNDWKVNGTASWRTYTLARTRPKTRQDKTRLVKMWERRWQRIPYIIWFRLSFYWIQLGTPSNESVAISIGVVNHWHRVERERERDWIDFHNIWSFIFVFSTSSLRCVRPHNVS